jgi:hypothetical protein
MARVQAELRASEHMKLTAEANIAALQKQVSALLSLLRLLLACLSV